MQRNIMDQKASTIANLLSQGYSQAQAQAMSAFEQQQARQMQAGQGIGPLGAPSIALLALDDANIRVDVQRIAGRDRGVPCSTRLVPT